MTTLTWHPTRAVVLQARGHLLRGRFVPEWAARPRLAAGGLEAAGHPGILAGASGTWLLGAGEGEVSGRSIHIWMYRCGTHMGSVYLYNPWYYSM